jgi:hypothetical protein
MSGTRGLKSENEMQCERQRKKRFEHVLLLALKMEERATKPRNAGGLSKLQRASKQILPLGPPEGT